MRDLRERNDEKRVRALVRAFADRGILVRREKLSRGSSFRVQSGNCVFSGENIVFVDRRLPMAQQLSLMADYLADLKIKLAPAELEKLGGWKPPELRED